jgi:hypothetical protein
MLLVYTTGEQAFDFCSEHFVSDDLVVLEVWSVDPRGSAAPDQGVLEIVFVLLL